MASLGPKFALRDALCSICTIAWPAPTTARAFCRFGFSRDLACLFLLVGLSYHGSENATRYFMDVGIASTRFWKRKKMSNFTDTGNLTAWDDCWSGSFLTGY